MPVTKEQVQKHLAAKMEDVALIFEIATECLLNLPADEFAPLSLIAEEMAKQIEGTKEHILYHMLLLLVKDFPGLTVFKDYHGVNVYLKADLNSNQVS